jgi:hypothetical protein
MVNRSDRSLLGAPGACSPRQGEKWLLAHNQRGEQLLELLGDEVQISETGSAGKRVGPVKAF